MKFKILICFLILLAVALNCSTAYSTVLFPKSPVEKSFSPVHLLLAEHFASSGNMYETETELMTVLRYEPTNVKALLYMGLVLESQKQNDNAAKYYKKILTVSPDQGDVYYYLGLLSEKNRKTAESLKYLNKATELLPYNAFLQYDIGSIYAKKEDYQSALPFFQKAVKLNPEFAEANNNLCYGLTNIGKPQEAIPYCEKAVALNPNSAPTLDSIGFMYYCLKDYQKALVFYKKALSIDDKISELHYHLALTLEKIGNVSAAIESYNKFLALESGTPLRREVKNVVKLLVKKEKKNDK